MSVRLTSATGCDMSVYRHTTKSKHAAEPAVSGGGGENSAPVSS